jgi:hypothetical protein
MLPPCSERDPVTLLTRRPQESVNAAGEGRSACRHTMPVLFGTVPSTAPSQIMPVGIFGYATRPKI